MTDEQLIKEFQNVEDVFNQAIISNDLSAISKCISEDWVLIDAQGGIIPRERFYYVLEQGLLRHTTMTKEILRVKIYDSIALVTGRGKNTGFFKNQFIIADEWVTDIYKKEKDNWVCVLTHLTPVAEIK
ncbi:MAG: nuclear transport factor 2 family protein [Cyclobacteriaceae bacterium]